MLCFLLGCFYPAQAMKEEADFVDVQLVLNSGKDACCQLRHDHHSEDIVNPQWDGNNFSAPLYL